MAEILAMIFSPLAAFSAGIALGIAIGVFFLKWSPLALGMAIGITFVKWSPLAFKWFNFTNNSNYYKGYENAVSYTHLTLPTIYSV